MSRLIIGHVDSKSARIWVRGSESHPVATLVLEASDGSLVEPKPCELEARHFYTGVVEVKGLEPEQAYECRVNFLGTGGEQQLSPKYGSGRFKTPPERDTPSAFSFLLVSCNLHSLGIFAAPDDAYRKLSAMAKRKSARFAIHAGDQIYYDVPNWGRQPSLESYRKTYLDAWEDCEPAAEFLTQLPHYMILDDHEIIDDFANDRELSSGAPNYLQLAMANKVYREFQHIHNPQSYGSGPLFYRFDSGAARFFVLDTRTERYHSPPDNQMISPEQFRHFRNWLRANKDNQLFVVTSIPFVANVRQSDDKWCSAAYRWQREKILELIWKHDVRRICFLTGDMHNSQHATLTLKDKSKGKTRSDIVIHELMSSPVNQLGKNRIGKYDVGDEPPVDGRIPFDYSTQLKASEFYTGHSNAMAVSVTKSKVSYEVYRTKKTAMKVELSGSFSF